MKTEGEHRRELISLPDQTLETLIDMRFVWLDSVPRKDRDEFYDRQRIAEEILAERRGTPQPIITMSSSAWTRPKPSF